MGAEGRDRLSTAFYACACVYTYTYTYIHTHTYIYTHTYPMSAEGRNGHSTDV